MELAFAGLHQPCAPMLGRLRSAGRTAAARAERRVRAGRGRQPGPVPGRSRRAQPDGGDVGKRPLLCVVDDAQWLDRASAQVLGFVGRRLRPSRSRWCSRCASQMPSWPGCRRLEVRGLRDDHAGAAGHDHPGTARRERVRPDRRGDPRQSARPARALPAPRPGRTGRRVRAPDTGDLPRRIEDQYIERLGEFPPGTQRMILLAAADPVGDTALVFRAAGSSAWAGTR